ncbi:hypothetical protein MNAN1_003013 [Malassezia nana]|uniref:BZIP domain-containing protein n=1 Tax=Malassezia nana TaxID=180528 RepID=A0AAF0EL35_9BASI|nr:hypothetical protein MNAN1_003013 [Malassezia nana]
MSAEHSGSIAFLLGLNEFPGSAQQSDQGDTASHTLLADLNSVAPNEPADDAMTTFANQLSLWTNASFSFDGPMGHALLPEDEKDGKPAPSEEEKREDEERYRQRAASSAHSNAAREKLLAVDREPMTMPASFGLPSPLPPMPSMTEPAPSPQAPWLGAPVPPVPDTRHAAERGNEAGPWDLTSTLALQYLLNKNPDMVASLWQGQGGAGPAAAPVRPPTAAWAPPATSMPPPGVPSTSSQPLAGPANSAPVPALQRKRSSSSVETQGGAPVVESKVGDDAQAPAAATAATTTTTTTSRPRSGGSSLAERVKLVDTGNPEADAEANRLAIEEDKRRRNTAASARFRIKKKQREAALEMSARELESQVNELKQENERLRTENEWLRRLITVRPEGLSAVMGSPLGQAPCPSLVPPLGEASRPPTGSRPDTHS